MKHISAMPLLMIASLIVSGPAVSGTPGLLGLKTPTGDIQCMIDEYGMADGSYPPFLRCDIREMTAPPPPRPDNCEFDWGSAFSIAQEDQTERRLCVSDSVASDRWEVLGYGSVWQQMGFTCLSEQTGLTCFNAKRHRFTLSRASQKLFGSQMRSVTDSVSMRNGERHPYWVPALRKLGGVIVSGSSP